MTANGILTGPYPDAFHGVDENWKIHILGQELSSCVSPLCFTMSRILESAALHSIRASCGRYGILFYTGCHTASSR